MLHFIFNVNNMCGRMCWLQGETVLLLLPGMHPFMLSRIFTALQWRLQPEYCKPTNKQELAIAQCKVANQHQACITNDNKHVHLECPSSDKINKRPAKQTCWPDMDIASMSSSYLQKVWCQYWCCQLSGLVQSKTHTNATQLPLLKDGFADHGWLKVGRARCYLPGVCVCWVGLAWEVSLSMFLERQCMHWICWRFAMNLPWRLVREAMYVWPMNGLVEGMLCCVMF